MYKILVELQFCIIFVLHVFKNINFSIIKRFYCLQNLFNFVYILINTFYSSTLI